jgi:hypothetical protein
VRFIADIPAALCMTKTNKSTSRHRQALILNYYQVSTQTWAVAQSLTLECSKGVRGLQPCTRYYLNI